MHLTFGLNLDGCDTRPSSPLSGKVTVGVEGLINILATRLGVPAPSTPQIQRIIEFSKILASVDNDKRFFNKSYHIDKINTAATLLNWRDAWIAAGWNGKCGAGAPLRLKDMADIELKIKTDLSPGPADHFIQIKNALASAVGKPDLKITCIDAKEHIPPHIVEVLERLDTTFIENNPTPSALPTSDLGKLQRALLDNKKVLLTQDASLNYIDSVTQTNNASWVSQYCSNDCLFLTEQPTFHLDSALAASNIWLVRFSTAS